MGTGRHVRHPRSADQPQPEHDCLRSRPCNAPDRALVRFRKGGGAATLGCPHGIGRIRSPHDRLRRQHGEFGSPLGTPFADELLFQGLGFKNINGGHFFDLRNLPTRLQTYVIPTNFRVSSVFPYITLPDVPKSLCDNHTLFATGPTGTVTNDSASIPVDFRTVGR
jgi:hypothetical protein